MFGSDDDGMRIPIEPAGEAEDLGDSEAWAFPGEAQAEIERLQQEVADAKEKYVRLVAEMDNFRRRMQDERARQVDQANDELLREILTVVDDLERAAHSSFSSAEAMHKGVQLIHDKLVRILAGMGVEAFVSAGHAFDPYRHEAVECVTSRDHEENVVVRELQKGYMRGEKLLRPARVAVATPPQEKGEE
jgi:molecular chaperone GrpE